MNSLSIVIPTKNEQDNIFRLIYWGIGQILDCEYEVIVVDDSADKTKERAEKAGARVIQGKGKGLGQAIIDGIKEAKNDIIVVMDADCSHDPIFIMDLVRPIINQGYDMTVGSRYARGKTIGWEWHRKLISRTACLLALPVTSIKDSTSGFFAVKKSLVDNVKLEGKSWKIMLEILVKAKPIRVCEVPIVFEVRKSGKSKFNRNQVVAYVKHLISLTIYKYSKFLKFAIVGGIGAIETFGITYLLTEMAHVWYMLSMVFAVVFATISNFILNSMWTFGVEHSSSDPDYEWNAYYKGNFIQRYWKKGIIQKVKNVIESFPESKVLDVGCGSSPMGAELGIVGYTGVDGNSAKIAYMKKKGLPFTYLHCNLGEEPLVHGGNDVSMSIEVIEHMPNMDAARKLVALLVHNTKPKGQVIIATPDYGKPLWGFIERVYGMLMPSAYADDHQTKFDEETLVSLCSEFNLKHETTQYVAGCDMICSFRKE